ncbi:MAG: hypothetical protein G3M78_07895 [Candidatus Nitrohelix vancouverensis]|uniref:Type I phosphodiesterase/nucleotide pyrophosphatase n=1 Tax=Candidatus Nitrohelix vancouverensis TaxID=2705534 RepID=A0A7T0G3E1_9BACT|nr:MAG: hypothetical protein G3M78_07895 [Candidatus Nitrohelix vancouverensis]
MPSHNKTLALGLDGVSFTLLERYINDGHLPEFKKIRQQGHSLTQMDASIPDVSSTSWTSFMTGSNPGEHGIFGFVDLLPNSYEIFFPNFTNITAPTVWEIMENGSSGKTSLLSGNYKNKFTRDIRSIILNIPQTYPAQKLNGLMTAGFVCPDLKTGTFPQSLYNYLISIGYIPDVDATKAVSAPEEFFSELFLALDKRLLAYEHLMENESWDLFMGGITETDRLHHFFYDAAFDANHPRHETFVKFYKKLDTIVGRLFNKFMDQTQGKGLFITVSDHGFTESKKEVYLNAWLKKQGFLKLNPGKSFYEQIETPSQAFAMDPGRLYINEQGKFPRGSVNASGKDLLLKELEDGLSQLKDDDGIPIIRSVYKKEDLYSGQSSSKGPDLVCLANDGYDLKGYIQKEALMGKGPMTGMHTSYDAHCILPSRLYQDRLHIEDVASLILDHIASEN